MKKIGIYLFVSMCLVCLSLISCHDSGGGRIGIGCAGSPTFSMKDYIKKECQKDMTLGIAVNIFGERYKKVSFSKPYKQCSMDPDGECSRSGGLNREDKNLFFERSWGYMSGDSNDMDEIEPQTKEQFLNEGVFVGLSVFPAPSGNIAVKDFIAKECHSKISLGKKVTISEIVGREFGATKPVEAVTRDVEYLTVRFSDKISKCVISDYFEIIYPEDKLTDSTEIIIRIDGQAPNVSSVEELLNIVPKKYITIDIDTSSDKDPVGCAWYKYNFRKQAEYLGNKLGFGFYVGGSSMDRVYSYFDTPYSEKDKNTLIETCRNYASTNESGTRMINNTYVDTTVVEGVKFSEQEDKTCIMDMINCYFTKEEEELVFRYSIKTFSSNKPEVRVGDFISEECKAGITFENTETASVITVSLEECLKIPVDDVLTSYHPTAEKHSVKVDENIIKAETLEELLDTKIEGNLQFVPVE